MHVRSVHMQDFRCFRDATISFEAGEGRVDRLHLLLGDNGTGKTSVLRAIALATLGEAMTQSGFVPRNLVRRHRKQAVVEARVVLHENEAAAPTSGTDGPTLTSSILDRGVTEFVRVGSPRMSDATLQADVFDPTAPSFLVFGYGATRRVDASEHFDPQLLHKVRSPRYQRVAGLFEDHVALVPLGSWFYRRAPHVQRAVGTILNEVLPAGVRFLDTPVSDEPGFDVHGTRLPFSALSDGFRIFVGLVADLLYHLHQVLPSVPPEKVDEALRQLPGILLIDEVDLHLHPSWQRTVLGALSRALPRMQIIAATHSPLVAGTMHRDAITILEVEPEGHEFTVTARQPTEDVFGLNADQILVSSYFGLSTTRAPSQVKHQRELALRAAEGDAGAALEFVRGLARKDDEEP